MLRVQRSAQHLADHFEEYPLLLFSFVQFDPTGGSIFPATWSAMLAARAEGVGASLTSVFVFQLDDVLEILGVPKQEGWLFSSCVTFGYPTGRWGVAPRRPVHEVSFRNRWGTPSASRSTNRCGRDHVESRSSPTTLTRRSGEMLSEPVEQRGVGLRRRRLVVARAGVVEERVVDAVERADLVGEPSRFERGSHRVA